MRVKILRLGTATRECDLPAGSLVQDALQKAGLDSTGFSVTCNGMGVSLGAAVSDADIICLVPKVEGGNA